MPKEKFMFLYREIIVYFASFKPEQIYIIANKNQSKNKTKWKSKSKPKSKTNLKVG